MKSVIEYAKNHLLLFGKMDNFANTYSRVVEAKTCSLPILSHFG